MAVPVAFVGAGAGVAVAILAAWRERRRHRRADFDRVGWIDWRSVQLAALVVAMILVSIGLNAR
jgi:hypothetical protein